MKPNLTFTIEALMRQVYEKYGLNPNDCGFVEAHGTGTRVGDPIEATALHNVLGQKRTSRDPLMIGSVKSNIGHLEAASGMRRTFFLPTCWQALTIAFLDRYRRSYQGCADA